MGRDGPLYPTPSTRPHPPTEGWDTYWGFKRLQGWWLWRSQQFPYMP